MTWKEEKIKGNPPKRTCIFTDKFVNRLKNIKQHVSRTHANREKNLIKRPTEMIYQDTIMQIARTIIW